MTRRWYLEYKIDRDQTPPLDTLIEALDVVFEEPLAIHRDKWWGNPRDCYARWVRGTTRSGPISVNAELALEYTHHLSKPADIVDMGCALLTLDGDTRDAMAMDALWGRVSAVMEALGYRDDTLGGPTAAIVELLVSAGALDRAATLRSAITQALIDKFRRGPVHWPLVATHSRADDLDRALRSALDPTRIKSISLDGCGLKTLPEVMQHRPVFFPALENLALGGNLLTSVPELKTLYLKLKWLNISGNPMKPPTGPAWSGVQIIS